MNLLLTAAASSRLLAARGLLVSPAIHTQSTAITLLVPDALNSSKGVKV